MVEGHLHNAAIKLDACRRAELAGALISIDVSQHQVLLAVEELADGIELTGVDRRLDDDM